MALSRVKTWISGEVLTASDLNAEYNNILNNPTSLISPLTGAISLNGKTITLDAAAATSFVSSAAVSWNFTSGAKTGTPATTGSVANWSAQTFTDSATAGSGTATAFVAHGIQRPTLAATNSSVVTTDAATFYIANAPAAGTNETLTNAYALWTDDGTIRFDPSASIVSAAGATYNGVNITAQTATISGSTNITTATGVNFVSVGQPTLSAGTALTVTNAATLYISAAPTGAGAGPATITNAYALWVDNGAVRFDGAATVSGDASLATVSGAAIATQADMESASATNLLVTPGRQHLHPSAPKAWVSFNSAVTISASYNITSVTDNGTGTWSVVIATDFSSAAYVGLAFGGFGNSAGASRGNIFNAASTQLAGTFNVVSIDGVDGVTLRDPTTPDQIYAAFLGDQ